MQKDFEQKVVRMAAEARKASRSMATLSTDVKNRVLMRMGTMLYDQRQFIQMDGWYISLHGLNWASL